MSGNSSTSRWGTGVALLLAGLLVVSSVGPAVAAPRVFVAGASLDTKEAVSGEAVTVNIRLGNTGDSGGATSVEISSNGERIKSNQYAVEAGERRTVTTNLSFAEPGAYKITVNGKSAGTVVVNRTVVETIDRRTDGRTMLVRAGQIGTDQRVSTSFPATNDSLAVTSLTARTSQSGFERNVSTYTDASSAPMALPSGDGTTVFGAVTVEQLSGVNDKRVRIGVNQSVVDAANVSSDEISIYSGDGTDFDRAETTFEGTVDGRYVYEARTNDTETLFLGSLAPVFEVSDHDLSTSESGIEKEIVVSATARNVGDVTGNYTASMLIDGEVVTTETVSLAPGENRTVTTSHGITRDGNYRVTLDDQFVGSVVVSTGDAEQTETATDGAADDATESGTPEPSDGATDQPPETDTETDAGEGDGGGFDVSIPEPDVGLTEIAIGGSVAVIGVLLVLLRRW